VVAVVAAPGGDLGKSTHGAARHHLSTPGKPGHSRTRRQHHRAAGSAGRLCLLHLAKEGSTTTLSTTRFLKASTAGNYKVKVTETNGCGTATGTTTTTTTIPATTVRVEAESFIAMSGVLIEGGNRKTVGYIDNGDWMDYSIDALTTGTYSFKFRLSSPQTGGQLQVRNAAGTVLKTVAVPNTGDWHNYTDVLTTLTLSAGTQIIRIQSGAIPKWNFDWFEFTNPASTSTGGGSTGGFSAPFLVVNASGVNGPDAPTSLTAVAISKTAIQVSWSQSTSPAYNETGFEVYQATAAAGPYTFRGLTAADAASFTATGLTSGVVYHFRVRAVNNNAASAA
jgi:hypothetical protein